MGYVLRSVLNQSRLNLCFICFIVAMVIKTKTPSVKVRLKFQQKLHCQFDVDHKGAKVTVEWHRQHRGERTTLFSFSHHTGEKQGSGVDLKALAAKDASYTLASTMMSSEGTYICSVSLKPLFASVNINLHIEGEENSQKGHRSLEEKILIPNVYAD